MTVSVQKCSSWGARMDTVDLKSEEAQGQVLPIPWHASSPHQLPEPPPQLSIPAHSLQAGVRAQAEGSPRSTIPQKAHQDTGMESRRGNPALPFSS